jgi:Zn-dependent protease
MIEYLRVDPLLFALLAIAIIEAIALHEYAHALAADLQGDRMPRAFGRLSLNPAKHLDPLGTILIFLVGFGWGKPVEFRPEALASKRFGAAIVALAGPAMNLLLAMGAAFVLAPLVSAGNTGIVARFLLVFFSINLLLAVFNLIPLPPLDGSRLLTIFLPPSKQKVIFFLDRYGFIILLAIVFFGWTTIIAPFHDAVGRWVLRLAGGDELVNILTSP